MKTLKDFLLEKGEDELLELLPHMTQKQYDGLLLVYKHEEEAIERLQDKRNAFKLLLSIF